MARNSNGSPGEIRGFLLYRVFHKKLYFVIFFLALFWPLRWPRLLGHLEIVLTSGGLDKNSLCLYLQGMKSIQRPIINIQSGCESVDYYYHLDWFETGIWCDYSDLESILEKIKKNLSPISLRESFGNSHYQSSLKNDDFGVNIFFHTRTNKANPPISLCLTGKFFRYGFHIDFINRFLAWFPAFVWAAPTDEQLAVYKAQSLLLKNPRQTWGWPSFRMDLNRIDASVDFISYGEKPFVPKPGFNPNCKRAPGVHYDFEYRGDSGGIKQWWFGKDGCRISVYDKLKDPHDVEYLSRHPEYGVGAHVWRVEFKLAKNELKTVHQKQPRLFRDYDSVFVAVFGQAARRYVFDGFNYEASLVSTYRKRQKTSDESSLAYFTNKTLQNFKRVQVLENIVHANKPTSGRKARVQIEDEIDRVESNLLYADFEQLSLGVPF